jgi:hypothetical protein
MDLLRDDHPRETTTAQKTAHTHRVQSSGHARLMVYHALLEIEPVGVTENSGASSTGWPRSLQAHIMGAKQQPNCTPRVTARLLSPTVTCSISADDLLEGAVRLRRDRNERCIDR